MATFSAYQQVFTLSMFANGESQKTENGKTVQQMEQDLTTRINGFFSNPALQNLIGNWSIAWGPIVFQNTDQKTGQLSGVADNAMFVAYNDATKYYVVAIAATNPFSVYDEKVEDLDVAAVNRQPVPSGSGKGELLSGGTAIGIGHLMDMTSGGVSLVKFLGNIQNKKAATLVFTGHSLGGALSPALAYTYMNPNGQGGLNKSDWGAAYVYPTAGPTPGNTKFVSAFNTLFPLSSSASNTWQTWNGLVWNKLDIVPHAWANIRLFPAEGILDDIRKIYLPNLAASTDINNLVTAAETSAFGGDYEQLHNNGGLPGSFNSNLPSTGQQTCDFLAQAYYQHIAAYYQLLAVEELVTIGVLNVPPIPPDLCNLSSNFLQKSQSQVEA